MQKGTGQKHLNDMRADGNSWITVYRKLDKTDNNTVINLHLKTSKKRLWF